MENKQPQAVILSMTRDGEKLCAAGGRISTQPGEQSKYGTTHRMRKRTAA